ncbi:MAG: hypothetical protein IT370_01770 [Deltaproteobacteria bacterium]|nr:hypothetical protein [Deltaproteobacteria bacterium]
MSWLLVVCPLLGLGCSKKAKGPQELPPSAAAPSPPGPTASAPTPSAPTPSAPTPITTAPLPLPAGGGSSQTYCIGGADADGGRSVCAGQASKHPAWHRHGFVKSRKDGACYECWDEESSECEEKPLAAGYQFVGAEVSGCAGAPMADPARGLATP